MEKCNFAPVLIPTLCRYEHFKRCLESLERCTGADNTDVYVGLDYPPSEKYVDGWKQIDAYLKKKEINNGFKNLYVRRRDHNCGVAVPSGNDSLLYDEIRLVSDRFIFSEDDNEFAPNFLEYINWGLNEFKDDESIYAICGYKELDTHDINNNVYKLNNIFSAWGFGSWFKRRDKYLAIRNHDSMKEIVKNASLSVIFTRRVRRLSSLLIQLANNTFWEDMLIGLLPKEEKWCVFPKVNLVRNWGWDGTGIRKGAPDIFEKCSTIPIDECTHFTPMIVEDLFNPVVLERFRKQYKTTKKWHPRAVVTFLTYKFTGCIPVANKENKWCKVKLLKVQ